MVDTVRTQTALLTTLFQDGQAAGEITEQDMRDLIVSIPANVTDGWATYSDGTYTSGSPLAISSGVRTKLTNDAATSTTSYTSKTFWNSGTNKVQSDVTGGCYDMRITFTAEYASGTNVGFDIDLDIGGSIGIIAKESKIFLKASSTPQSFMIPLPYFSLATFVANGGDIYITPNANIDVYDIAIYIINTFKPQV